LASVWSTTRTCVNTDDDGTVADSATGMSLNEDGEFEYSEPTIYQENESNDDFLGGPHHHGHA
jgi:hypothetical protein